jgi:hypothetical protein
LPGISSNYNPSDLCLLISWDHKCDLTSLGLQWLLDSLGYSVFDLRMYCTRQQTTCSLNTAVRTAIIKKLRGQVLLAHPVILATGEAEI